MAKFVKADGFDAKAESFVHKCQELMNEWFKRYPNLKPDRFSFDPLVRYLRIVRADVAQDGTEGSRSVFCFIEYTTGDVFKADGWKKPAKHTRGNIFSPQNGLEAVNPHGVSIHYLK